MRIAFVGAALAAAIKADFETWNPAIRGAGFDDWQETQPIPFEEKKGPVYMTNVRISQLASRDGTLHDSVKNRSRAESAADDVFDAGGSPRAQLDAARKASGQKRLAYLPHTGMKQLRKAASRAKAD